MKSWTELITIVVIAVVLFGGTHSANYDSDWENKNWYTIEECKQRNYKFPRILKKDTPGKAIYEKDAKKFRFTNQDCKDLARAKEIYVHGPSKGKSGAEIWTEQVKEVLVPRLHRAKLNLIRHGACKGEVKQMLVKKLKEWEMDRVEYRYREFKIID